MGLVVYYLMFYNKKTVKSIKVLNEIKEYGYQLGDNKNAKYKKLFYSLEKILDSDSVDEEKYVKTIAKMFIIDFYSLNDKLAKTDVGGSDFVYSGELTDFLEKAQNTMYKYVESNLYDQRKQDLPEVDEVTIEKVEQSPFTYGDKEDDQAYVVTVNWKYTDTATSNGYQDSATMTFIHDDKKLALAEFK